MGMATHSSILAWRIPWTEEPGGLQSMESQRVTCDWMTNTVIFLILFKVSFLQYLIYNFILFPCGSAGKESTCNVGHLGLILGLGRYPGKGKGYPLQYYGLENSKGLQRIAYHWMTFTFHFHALKEMATHSSVLAWRILGTGEPGRLPSMGSHRVGHKQPPSLFLNLKVQNI